MSTAAPTPAEAGPLDLHHEHMVYQAAGFDRDLTLPKWTVQRLAARIRGIEAIAAVLQVGDVVDVCSLGDYLRGGLLDGLAALAADAHASIQEADDHARAKAPARPSRRA